MPVEARKEFESADEFILSDKRLPCTSDDAIAGNHLPRGLSPDLQRNNGQKEERTESKKTQ
jgi:hypothetical protein